PPSPFALPVYHLATSDSAERFEVAADSTTALSTSANRTGDSYVLVAVILAIVLFFASASQRAMRSGLRWMLMAVASVACAGGIVRLFMLPRG
ncbi:MAG: hypothetical protein ACREPM_20750, partial [Gemmatimonadaceae bacterium]